MVGGHRDCACRRRLVLGQRHGARSTAPRTSRDRAARRRRRGLLLRPVLVRPVVRRCVLPPRSRRALRRRCPPPRPPNPPQPRDPRDNPRDPRDNPRDPRGNTRGAAPNAGYGSISIRVQPGDAEVLIDGEKWRGPGNGQDPLIVEVAEGPHTIQISKSGYRTYITDVQVRRGETEPLNVSLRSQNEQ